jgi:hypothetical protein
MPEIETNEKKWGTSYALTEIPDRNDLIRALCPRPGADEAEQAVHMVINNETVCMVLLHSLARFEGSTASGLVKFEGVALSTQSIKGGPISRERIPVMGTLVPHFPHLFGSITFQDGI